MHIGWRLKVELAQAGQRDISDSHLSTHAGSHPGGSLSNYTTAQHQHAGWRHTGHTTDQLALATLCLLQVVGTVQRSHTTSHLTHRLQQGQCTIRQLYRLVSQTDGTTLQHGICQFLLARKMEIGEQQLPLTHQVIFRLDGFLHLHNHLSLAIYVLNSGQDSCTRLHIVVIAEATTLASRMLHQDLMTATSQFCHSRRGHTHAVLIVLNFLGNTYLTHKLSFLVVLFNL